MSDERMDKEEFPRLRELATRLVASGPKASHVSASETHEISDGLTAALDEVERLTAALTASQQETERLRALLERERQEAQRETDIDSSLLSDALWALNQDDRCERERFMKRIAERLDE